jgi:hypothetical protein
MHSSKRRHSFSTTKSGYNQRYKQRSSLNNIMHRTVEIEEPTCLGQIMMEKTFAVRHGLAPKRIFKWKMPYDVGKRNEPSY